jgi:serine/tyrosine/threonine adenylyltransferase
LLNTMHKHSLDYTNTFRDLSTGDIQHNAAWQTPEFQAWHARWQQRLQQQAQSMDEAFALMQRHNPSVIARNHLVEAALQAATQHGDLQPFEDLLKVLSEPFAPLPPDSTYRQPAPPSDKVYQTFCGT